jgi:tRNA pseudouridine38-40 synthase
MNRRNIRLELSYDGTGFCGWQKQAEERTVQGILEKALFTMHKHPVTVTAAGRTDTGVHATGQVVNFFTDLHSIAGQQFRDALNYYLPPDVRVLKSVISEDNFHARFSARKRTYCYYLYFGDVSLPHKDRHAVRFRNRPDIRLLNRCASVLIGEHDFTTFAGAGDKSKSKKRIVYSSCFYIQGEMLVYKIQADSFLYRMVRSIVGTLLEIDRTGKTEKEFALAVKAMDRSCAGPTAPARGLFLDKVIYGKEDTYSTILESR